MNKLRNISIEKSVYIYVSIILAVTSITPIFSNDLWWHISTGQYIIEHKNVAHIAVYSWYGEINNIPWINQEWLSALFFNIIHKFFGVPIFIFIVAVIFFICLYKSLTDSISVSKNSNFILIFWAGLSIIILRPFLNPRPFLLSWIFFIISLSILYKYNQDTKKPLWHLIIISILWHNFHGGSAILLFILIFTFIIGNFFDFKIGKLYSNKKENKHLKKLIITFFLCIFAALINPYGYKMLLYPLINMNDKLMINNIAEWAVPDFHSIYGMCVFILIMIIIFTLITTETKINIVDMLFMGGFLYMGLKCTRFIPYFYFNGFYLLAKYSNKITMIKPIKNEYRIKIFLFLISSIFIIYGGINAFTVIKEPYIKDKFPSDELVQKIIELQPDKMYNDYNWGGYLIYELMNENIKVFIDGRADAYSNYTLQDYLDLHNCEENYEKIISKYKFDLFVLSKGTKLGTLLKTNQNYKVIYEDELGLLIVNK